MIHIANPYPRSVIETGMVHANVPTAVYDYLKAVFPGHGNIQAVTCTLINQLVIALKSHGIERFDLENEQLILSVLAGRNPNHKSARKAGPRNVRARTQGVRRSPKKRPSKQQRPRKQDSSGDGGEAARIVQDD